MRTSSHVVVVAIAVLAACAAANTRGPDPRPTATVSALPAASSVAASSSAPAPLPPPSEPEEIVAWTDPGAIAALAKDCSWQPDAPPESAGPEAFEPMRCERIPTQMCQMDACLQSDYDCYPKCAASCDGCAGECVKACASCKAACTDAACTKACATSCGECRQGCLKDLDHCTSATCSEVMGECAKAELAEWRKTKCDKVCEKVAECWGKCPEQMFASDCTWACAKRFMNKTCPDKWLAVCIGYAQSPESLFGPREPEP